MCRSLPLEGAQSSTLCYRKSRDQGQPPSGLTDSGFYERSADVPREPVERLESHDITSDVSDWSGLGEIGLRSLAPFREEAQSAAGLAREHPEFFPARPTSFLTSSRRPCPLTSEVSLASPMDFHQHSSLGLPDAPSSLALAAEECHQVAIRLAFAINVQIPPRLVGRHVDVGKILREGGRVTAAARPRMPVWTLASALLQGTEVPAYNAPLAPGVVQSKGLLQSVLVSGPCAGLHVGEGSHVCAYRSSDGFYVPRLELVWEVSNRLSSAESLITGRTVEWVNQHPDPWCLPYVPGSPVDLTMTRARLSYSWDSAVDPFVVGAYGGSFNSRSSLSDDAL